ncbi:MAG: protein TolQ [Nitrospirae bacterium]|nr:MAG: protein TolQ [Nitrospirota bacterium]
MRHSVLGLILGATLVVKLVMLLLLFFSVVSWAIIILKWRVFSRVKRENEIFFRLFRQERNPKDLYQATRSLLISPLARVFREAYSENRTDREELRRSIKRFVALEAARLERYLNFLATTGSTTPFIGLFGTVWGIMNAFQGIGASGSASLAVVAPGIAEALIATAMGLAAAIPAVIGYNYYLSMAGRTIIQLEDFAEELLDYLIEGKTEEL